MKWCIEKQGRRVSESGELGSQLMLGNGYLGWRGTLEEYRAEQLAAITLAGLYDKSTGWREPVNAPNPFWVTVSMGEKTISVLALEPLRHTQGVDLRRAVGWRESVFQTDEGQITINTRRFASHDVLPLMALEYTLTVDQPAVCTLRCGIDDVIWDLNGPHLAQEKQGCKDGCRVYTASTMEAHIPVAVAQWVSAPDSAKEIKDSCFEVTLDPRKPTTFYIYAAVCHSEADCLKKAVKITSEASKTGFEALLTAHEAFWHDIWEQANVEIEGDEEADTALRFSLYLLLSSAPFHTSDVAIPARGLSSQTYKGAMFWDTELYIFPFFRCVLPNVCRNLAQYRVKTLPGARRKAEKFGFSPGAFYAWESQETGNEACTPYGFTDVFTGRPMRTYFADKQIHISDDVAWGILSYYEATGDLAFLCDGGLEVLLECCRFLWQYAVYRPQRERYELWDVVSPDEYHERVNNDAYTNLITAEVLERTLSLTREMRVLFPEETNAMLRRTGLEDNLNELIEFSQKLYCPSPQEDGLVEQCDGFFGLEDASVTEVVSRKLREDEYLGGAAGVAAGTQVIKQADVVLAMTLLKDRFSPEVRAANYRYYNPRTEHGSTLSACIYALAAIDCGDLKEAMSHFRSSVRVDIDCRYKTWVSGTYMGGIHTAAAGGSWMVAVQGFAGFSITETGLALAPRLPQGWNGVRFKANWHGQLVWVHVAKECVAVEAAADNTRSCHVTVWGRGKDVPAGQKVEWTEV